MMFRSHWIAFAAVLFLQPPAQAGEPTTGKRFGDVTQARVLKELDSGENWLVNGGRFTGEHYSPLAQITDRNVKQLGLAWATDIPSPIGLIAEPIVVDGVAYVSAVRSVVYALDAATGELLWQFDPQPRLDMKLGTSISARHSRGVAVWDGKVYVGTGDCRLVAVDARRGTKVWEAPVCDPNDGSGIGITAAPRAGDGLVFMGYLASDLGARGSIAAFDAATGREVWRFWTVPGDPAVDFESPQLKEASKTWTGGWAKTGGGAVWEEIRYDPVTGSVIFGTASAVPLNVKMRGPGDNLFTNSVIALDAKTGAYRWHYQVVPEDAWDYDAVMPKVVTDLEWKGEKRRVVLEAPKNGFFYVLDAKTGELLAADPIAKVTWASHIDMETGRPVVVPAARYYDEVHDSRPVRVWPNLWGSHNWQPMSYSPKTELLYIPLTDMPSTYSSGGWIGARVELLGYGPDEEIPPDVGKLLAWDPVEREVRWSVDHPYPFNGGVLSTAGNLVFQGTATGEFSAYNAASGEPLWSRKTGSSIQGTSVSYQIGDDQYVLVPIGKGGGTAHISGIRTASPDALGPARLLAFKLGARGEIPITPREAPVPKPPVRTANAEQVERGNLLYHDYACMACHGQYVMGAEARVLGGGVPDLRYTPASVHAEWQAIVLDGSRSALGMPSFEGDGMSAEDSQAIQSYVIEQSWKHYEGDGRGRASR